MPARTISIWDDLTVADVVSNLFVETATLGLVFFAGAAVGSFVNVILYRLPRRMNLLWPPSRCPACGHRLRLLDNLPVVAWVRLRGQCRHCGTPIPRSYLLVEVRFGLLFLALMYLEIHTGGLNLPLRRPSNYIGALWTIWYPQPELLRIWVYHTAFAAVLGTLFAFLARAERVPGSFVVFAVVVGVGGAAGLGSVHQVPWQGDPHSNEGWMRAGVSEAVLGGVAGCLVGAAFARWWPVRETARPVEIARRPIPPRGNIVAVLAIAGVWLGWQAVVSAGVLLTAFGLVRPQARLSSLAIWAVAAHLVTWRVQVHHLPWWPGPRTPLWLMASWLAGLTAILLAAGRVLSDAEPITAGTDSPPAASEIGTPRTVAALPAADSTATSEPTA